MIYITLILWWSLWLQMKLHGDEDVNLSYKYMMNMDSDSAIQNNMLVEDSAYEWAPKRWSYCSKLCGGGTVEQGKYLSRYWASELCQVYLLNSLSPLAAGKQYLRYGCRRKVDSKMVHKSFCNKSNMKPRGDTRDCNQKPCPPPMYALNYVTSCKKNYNMRNLTTLS